MLNMDAVDRSADCPVGVDAAAMKKSKGDSAAGCSTASVCPGREKERVEEREERAGLPAPVRPGIGMLKSNGAPCAPHSNSQVYPDNR